MHAPTTLAQHHQQHRRGLVVGGSPRRHHQQHLRGLQHVQQQLASLQPPPARRQQHQQQQQQQRRAAVAAAAGRRQSPVASGLIQVLKDELKIEKERYRTPEAVLEGPPGGYELDDRPNCTVLLLSREYGDEEILVEVDIDSQGDGPDDEDDDEGGVVGGDDDEDGLDSLAPVTFSVNISKGDRIMAFACETDGTEVFINHVSLNDAPDGEGGDDDDDDVGAFAPYTGPVFSELDDTLQQAFADYLEERGINAAFGAYLLELVHDKLEVEYMNWLGRVRGWVES